MIISSGHPTGQHAEGIIKAHALYHEGEVPAVVGDTLQSVYVPADCEKRLYTVKAVGELATRMFTREEEFGQVSSQIDFPALPYERQATHHWLKLRPHGSPAPGETAYVVNALPEETVRVAATWWVEQIRGTGQNDFGLERFPGMGGVMTAVAVNRLRAAKLPTVWQLEGVRDKLTSWLKAHWSMRYGRDTSPVVTIRTGYEADREPLLSIQRSLGLSPYIFPFKTHMRVYYSAITVNGAAILGDAPKQ